MADYEPDILARGLDVVFCGINPALSAVAAGHNFSHRSNRFWPVLHLSGFTDVCLKPEDERRLLEYGYGITGVVRRPTAQAHEVSPEEFRQARLALEAKMRRNAPRCIAFLGKHAFSIMMGEPDVAWGPHRSEFVGALAWILPNPSGRNRSFTFDALVRAYSELRMALAAGGNERRLAKSASRGTSAG